MAGELGSKLMSIARRIYAGFNERIRLASRLINDSELANLLEEVETASNFGMLVTFFEVTTAAAMLAYLTWCQPTYAAFGNRAWRRTGFTATS